MAEEEVRLQDTDDGDMLARRVPDAAVLEISETRAEPTGGAIATVESVDVRVKRSSAKRRWIEIIVTASGNRVVTAIKILSPENKKAGGLNDEYIDKVSEYIDAGVNLVEIDLLRSSRRHMVVQTDRLPIKNQADYYTLVQRNTKPDWWRVYPMKLRRPLPTVPIPLRSTDDDAPLALQSVIERVYRAGGHYHTDYTAELPRPLTKADAKWAGRTFVGLASVVTDQPQSSG